MDREGEVEALLPWPFPSGERGIRDYRCNKTLIIRHDRGSGLAEFSNKQSYANAFLI